MDERNTGPGPRPKVARLLEKYELDGVGDELEAQWTHPENRKSLRTLAESFNERLVRTALEDAGVDTITEDVGYLYDLLRTETGSRGEQLQARRRLERAGVDVETLTDEFVSYGAIRSYLTGYRNASLPETTDDEVRMTERRAIEGLRQRTVAVTESKLARLRETDRLELGSHHVLTSVQVVCEECQTQYDVVKLLEAGGCECDTTEGTLEG
ncbi:rod-determining factor RdfA [Natronorubrum halophilum]|uniref:rod-determining factor RdfA n=1 Tax=Natronorubrum halophilum TaxID=1702106 RepID=UPI000EF72EF1|nr:rod-determining factor RdfA [Natronorubrum halophilum]